MDTHSYRVMMKVKPPEFSPKVTRVEITPEIPVSILSQSLSK